MDDDDEENETEGSFSFAHHNSKQNNFHKDFPLRNDFTDLRNLVETKSREIEQISNLLTNERKQHKMAIDEFEKRFAISEAERERVSFQN